MTHSSDTIATAFAHFIPGGTLETIEQCYGGHINQTYFVTHKSADATRTYVLQCLNRTVFPRLPELMDNVIRVSEHMAARCHDIYENPERYYLRFLRTTAGATSVDDPALGFWRMYRYQDNAIGKLVTDNLHEAYSAGEAFGRFQDFLSDMPPPRLHETIAHFHDTRRRYDALEAAVEQNPADRRHTCADVIDGLRRIRDNALIIQLAAEKGRLPERIVHNDAKLSNILLDRTDGHAICVIDLDTCMPGLALHDFGDLVRSICTGAAEDERDLRNITVRTGMFKALAAGFINGAYEMLTDHEIRLMPHAGIVLTTEVAVRFLTDYLNGDVYFATKYPDHNLVRARAQLTLAQRQIAALPELHAIVNTIADEKERCRL